MALQNGIIYNTVIKKCVDYVNKGWKTNYKVEDVALIDLSTTFIGVHFNKDDYSKDVYMFGIQLLFEYEDFSPEK